MCYLCRILQYMTCSAAQSCTIAVAPCNLFPPLYIVSSCVCYWLLRAMGFLLTWKWTCSDNNLAPPLFLLALDLFLWQHVEESCWSASYVASDSASPLHSLSLFPSNNPFYTPCHRIFCYAITYHTVMLTLSGRLAPWLWWPNAHVWRAYKH